jgi:hypothetical protein
MSDLSVGDRVSKRLHDMALPHQIIKGLASIFAVKGGVCHVQKC